MLRSSYAVLLLALAATVTPVAARAQGSEPELPAMRTDSLAMAADSGAPEAQYDYGRLHELGEGGVPQDYQIAAEWYRRAADQDHVPSLLALSTLYFGSDPQEAMRLVVRASFLGSAEAQWRAGQVLSGRIYLPGVITNIDEAERWYSESAIQGFHPAEEALADLYSQTEDPTRFTDTVLLYEAAAAGGSAWAQLRLGMMYATGEGVEQSDVEAWNHFQPLGSEFDLDPDRFSNGDLEVLGGLQLYYGLSFVGGRGEVDLEQAALSFERALQSPDDLIHPSFARAAQAMIVKIAAER